MMIPFAIDGIRKTHMALAVHYHRQLHLHLHWESKSVDFYRLGPTMSNRRGRQVPLELLTRAA